ncbi:MAG: class IV adenylate cyclase [Treponema sp.]|nr:class IV adenylate cyclase [Treponema sp.]
MTEIELKVHVEDRDALIEKLNSFATYTNCIQRDDFYWGSSATCKNKIRIRKESGVPNEPRETRPETIVTYKKKELRTNAQGQTIEVNDEKECTISNSEPIEAFLTDMGYSVVLKKHKSVMVWMMRANPQKESSVSFELCNVPPLGDFLEIEILTKDDSEENIKYAQDKLFELLDMTGIGRDKIEKRYYSEMLRELNSTE